jgi:hypothetical protein
MKNISIATWLNSRRTYTRCLPPTSMACCRKGYIHLLHYGTRSQGHKAPGRPKQRSHHLMGHSRLAAKALHSRRTSVSVPTTISHMKSCVYVTKSRTMEWSNYTPEWRRRRSRKDAHTVPLSFQSPSSLTIMSRA